jgi:uncharacterized protein
MSCTLLVLAKAPRAGWSKTRCSPPCTPEEAARLAAGALRDTLRVVQATPARRRVLVLDGRPGPWMVPGIELQLQRGDGLDERLEAAFVDAALGTDAPALLIGMDTPQVTVALLAAAATRLAAGADAVLGPACDGGYWAVGLQRAVEGAFTGVAMSVATTGAEQVGRLRSLGLAVESLPRLRDVDTWGDATAVAADPAAVGGCFAAAVAGIRRRIGGER